MSLGDYGSLFFLGGGGGAFTNCEKRHLASSRLICPAVCLSARPHGMTWLPRGKFSLNPIFEYFSKICRENSKFIEVLQE